MNSTNKKGVSRARRIAVILAGLALLTGCHALLNPYHYHHHGYHHGHHHGYYDGHHKRRY